MVFILPPPTAGRGLAAIGACIDYLDLVNIIANDCVLSALVSEPIQAVVRPMHSSLMGLSAIKKEVWHSPYCFMI
jgi:hypothetical protein